MRCLLDDPPAPNVGVNCMPQDYVQSGFAGHADLMGQDEISVVTLTIGGHLFGSPPASAGDEAERWMNFNLERLNIGGGRQWGYSVGVSMLGIPQAEWHATLTGLVDFWGIGDAIRIIGDTETYSVEAVRERWRVQVNRGRNWVPYCLTFFGWQSPNEPLEKLASAVAAYFPKVEYHSFGMGIRKESYEAFRPRLNAYTTDWTYSSGSMFEKGFDPFVRPDWASADDPVRLPLLYWYKGESFGEMLVPRLQVDIIHTAEHSFLELQSAYPRKKIAKFIAAAGVPCEFWEGPPQLRWDGHGACTSIDFSTLSQGT